MIDLDRFADESVHDRGLVRRGSRGGTDGVLHIPADNDASTPRCADEGMRHYPTASWDDRNPARVGEKYRLCTLCLGEHNTNKGEEIGSSTATKILQRAADDPDEVLEAAGLSPLGDRSDRTGGKS